jgi:hypothetical protein
LPSVERAAYEFHSKSFTAVTRPPSNASDAVGIALARKLGPANIGDLSTERVWSLGSLHVVELTTIRPDSSKNGSIVTLTVDRNPG